MPNQTQDNSFIIRPASLNDDAKLAEMTRVLLEYERTLSEPVSELNPWAASREELRKQLQHPNTQFFIAEQQLEEERQIVGYLKAVVIGKQLTRNENGQRRSLNSLIEQLARWFYTSVLKRPRPALQLEMGYISGLFVHPEMRRSGIGRKLTAVAEDWLRQQGIKTCELHVLESNETGRTFWQEVGYAPISVGMRKKL